MTRLEKSQNKNINKNDILMYLSFFALPIMFFSRIFIRKDIFLGSDFIQYFSSFYYYVEKLKELSFPVWDPYTYQGIPIFAKIDVAYLYPVNFFFALVGTILKLDLKNLYILYEYYPLFHISLGGLFTYLFLKDVGLSKFSSFISGFIFMFCGISLNMINTVPLISTFVWLPLQLMLFRKSLNYSIKKRKNKYIYSYLLLTLVTTLTHFAGYIQNTLYYIPMYLSIFFVFWVFQNKKIVTKRIIANNIIAFMAINILALGIYSVQLLPSIEFSGMSNRSTIDFDTAISYGAVNPYNLIDLVVQSSFRVISNGHIGNFITTPVVYFGISALFLIMLGIGSYVDLKQESQKYLILFFTFTSILFILISFGSNFSIYEYIVSLLPGLSNFRNVFKSIYLASLSLSILAGFGMENIIEKHTQLEIKKKINTYSLLLFIFCVLIFIIYYILIYTKKDLFSEELQKLIQDAYINRIIVFLILFYSTYLCIKLIKVNVIKVIFLLILFFDLANFNKYIIANNFRFEPVEYLSGNGKEFYNYINKDKSNFRVVFIADIYGMHYTPEITKINNASGYSSMAIKSSAENINNLFKNDTNSKKYSKELSNLGIKYVISGIELNNENLILVEKTKIDESNYGNYFYYSGDNLGTMKKQVGTSNYLYLNKLFYGLLKTKAHYEIIGKNDNRFVIKFPPIESADKEIDIEVLSPEYPGWQINLNGKLIQHKASKNGNIFFKMPTSDQESIITIEYKIKNIKFYALISSLLLSMLIVYILIYRTKVYYENAP